GIDDFSGIARHVTHHKIQLGHTDFERHGIGKTCGKRGIGQKPPAPGGEDFTALQTRLCRSLTWRNLIMSPGS
ncbi:MAG: hypothetical protein KUA38_03545, partial [Hydrogenophaga sp.]|nr:hypothetical protein [Hydrogenophaga sp.]